MSASFFIRVSGSIGIVLLSIALKAQSAFGIGHDVVDRYYPTSGQIPSYTVPPADLLAPTDRLMPYFGSFISPRWVLGAAHRGGPSGGGTMPVWIPNSLLEGIGTDGYTEVQFEVEPDGVKTAPGFTCFLNCPNPTPNLDVRLFKLKKDGTYVVGGETKSFDLDAENTNYFRIADDVDYTDKLATIGGFGRIYTQTPNGPVDGTAGTGGHLRWGRNEIESPLSASHELTRFDSPSAPDYVKYEGAFLVGDSGSGMLIRDGWEWKLVAALQTRTSVGGSGQAVRVHYNLPWIINTVDDIDLSQPLPSLSKPAATISWTGGSGSNWSMTGSWSPNRLPELNAATADIVAIESGSPQLGIGVNAEARDVFVGGTGGGWPTLTVYDGGSLETLGLFIGADTGEAGMMTINGGEVKAESQYIGHRGNIGVLYHNAGVNSSREIYVGDKDGTGYAAYVVNGSSDPGLLPYLETSLLEVDGSVPANVQFNMQIASGAYAETVSDRTIVGAQGGGTFNHAAGLHTVNNELILGKSAGSTGIYNLSGTSALTTSQTVVGNLGDATFTQSGGVHETVELRVGTYGTYTLSGGVVDTESVVIDGEFGVGNDGTLVGSFVDGVVDFDNGTGTIASQQNSISDFTDATFVNASNATLVVESDSLVLLDSQWTGQVNKIGTLNPHVVGNTLAIGNAGFRANGSIPDPVKMTDNGYIVAKDGNLHATEGIQVVSGGAAINAETGSRVQIYATVQDPGLTVADGASLSASGWFQKASADARLVVDGSLSISSIDSSPSADVLALNGGFDQSSILTLTESAELSMDISTSSSHDSLLILDANADIDGTLHLQFIDSYTPAPLDALMNVISTPLSLNNRIAGIFETITVDDGEPSTAGLVVKDVNDDDIAMAVLYCDNQGKCGELGQPVSGEDVSEIKIRPTLPGDLNLDDMVSIADNSIFETSFTSGLYTNGGAIWINGDLNGDGKVTIGDYAILDVNFGRSWPGGGGSSASAIPEPGTMSLVVLAMLAGAGFQRRR